MATSVPKEEALSAWLPVDSVVGADGWSRAGEGRAGTTASAGKLSKAGVGPPAGSTMWPQKRGFHHIAPHLLVDDPKGWLSFPRLPSLLPRPRRPVLATGDSVLPQRDASHLSLFLCMSGPSSAASLCLILSISPALLLTCPWILELLTPQTNPHTACSLLSSLPQAIPGWAHLSFCPSHAMPAMHFLTPAFSSYNSLAYLKSSVPCRTQGTAGPLRGWVG